MRGYIKIILIGILLFAWPRVWAGVITYDFEGFPDGTVLSNQFAGLQFTNASVWTAGLTLNELSFPPHSWNECRGGCRGTDHDSVQFADPERLGVLYLFVGLNPQRVRCAESAGGNFGLSLQFKLRFFGASSE